MMLKKIKLEIKEEQVEVEKRLRSGRIESSEVAVKKEFKDENETKTQISGEPTELGASVLYCIGGSFIRYNRRTRRKEYTPQPSISYMCYSLTTPTWKTIPWPHPRIYFGSVVHDYKIFIFGGFKASLCNFTIETMRKETFSDTIEVFDLRTMTWLPVRKLPRAIAGIGVCSFGDHIYFSGGLYLEGKGALGLLRYCPISDQFETLSRTRQISGDPQILALNGQLYCLCGDSGYSSMDRYDPDTGRWTELAPMNAGHQLITSVVHRGKIYVLGGYGLEVYCPDKNQWTKLAEFPGEKKIFGILASINDRLISVGNHGLPRSRKIYEFDFEAAVWIRKKDMNYARWQYSVLVYDPLGSQ